MKSIINENSVLMRLTFGHMGNNKKADKSLIDTGKTDKDRLNVSKRLFTDDSYHAIHAADGETKSWVLRRAIQVSIGFKGVYILPLSLLEEVEEKLNAYRKKRAELVDAFMSVYENERDVAMVRLAEQFNPDDYPNPEEARSRFSFSWRYVQFQVPEKLPKNVLARERKKLEESLKDTEQSVRLALREGMADLVKHLADKLEPAKDGATKRFYDSSVTNLVEFLQLLEKRDITNDEELRQLCAKAKQIIGNKTPEALRESSDKAKEKLASELRVVAEKASSLVEVVRKRKFDLED